MQTLKPLIVPQASGRILAASELKRLGVAPWRLYARDLSHPIHGVVAAQGVDPRDRNALIAAVRVIMDDGLFLSRRTAAAELQIPARPINRVEVGAVHPRKPRRRAEIAGHQLRSGVLRLQPEGPLWLPHAADVWGLMAAVCGLDELIAVGDFLISGRSRRETAACAFEELEQTVRRFRGGVGSPRLARALPLLRTGVESPAESRTRLLIVQAGLPEPMVSCPVAVAGRTLRADLGYPELKIAIEYDGEYHFSEGVERARWDNERVEAMIDAGWRVLRVTALDLQDPRRFLSRLAKAIEERRAEGFGTVIV